MRDLSSDLDEKRGYANLWAKLNSTIAHILFMLAILASFGTTLLASVPDISKLAIALVAAIPGVVILFDRTFSFARRADWFYIYHVEVEALIRELRDQHVPPPEVSTKLSELARRMEGLFPEMQASAISPVQKDAPVAPKVP
jgi:hypothetical protein